MTFQVVPPVAVQQEAIRTGEPISYFRGQFDRSESERVRPHLWMGLLGAPNLIWRHRVVIPRPFYLGTTPVTQAQFEAWTTSEEYQAWHQAYGHGTEPHKNAFPGHPERPAESMSWHEARAYTEWLNTLADTGRMQLPHGLRASLPSEERWEYACRAGTTTEYWSGDGEANLAQVGWFQGNAKETVESARLPANPWGLHDMHGNVCEWCEDAFERTLHLPNPGAPGAFRHWTDPGEGGPCRALRGGGWGNDSFVCSSALTWWMHPRWRRKDVGFRVMLSLA